MKNSISSFNSGKSYYMNHHKQYFLSTVIWTVYGYYKWHSIICVIFDSI